MKAYDVAYRVGGYITHVTVVAKTESTAVRKAMAEAKRQGYVQPPEFVSLTVLPRLLA